MAKRTINKSQAIRDYLKGNPTATPTVIQQDLLRDLRQADTAGERAEILRAALTPPGARWWLLDRLEGAGLGRAHLRVGSAALLADARPLCRKQVQPYVMRVVGQGGADLRELTWTIV